MSRFERQTILPGFGQEGQQKLSRAKILVVGAGGLGCPALLYLAAAGVGNIGIVDGDKVSLSNLNRQVLYGEGDVGKSKAQVAGEYIKRKYSDIRIDIIPHFLTAENGLDIIREYDLVLDGTDNFGTRYLVNDACFLLKKPLVFGAIYQHEGQVAILNVTGEDTEPLTYRDLFPHPPSGAEVPNCAETGVLGVLPGIIGTMQATEAIKYLSGFGKALVHKVLFYNLRGHSTYQMDIMPNPEGRKLIPIDTEAFGKMDYEIICGPGDHVSWDEVNEIFSTDLSHSALIDVREIHEEPKMDQYPYTAIPLSTFEKQPDRLPEAKNIYIFCQSGIRSLQAVKALKKSRPDKNIYSIEGGIKSLLNTKDK